MKTKKIAALAVIVLATALFASAAYSFLGGADPSRNMGNYRSFSFYADRPGNAASAWMQPGSGPPHPWDEFWFDNSGSFNLSSGLRTPGPVSIGATKLTANSLAELTSDANFNGEVELTSPITLSSALILSCALYIDEGAPITLNGYTLTENGHHLSMGAYQQYVGTVGQVYYEPGACKYDMPDWFDNSDYNAIQRAINATAGSSSGSAGQMSTIGVEGVGGSTYYTDPFFIDGQSNTTVNNLCQASGYPFLCCSGAQTGTCIGAAPAFFNFNGANIRLQSNYTYTQGQSPDALMTLMFANVGNQMPAEGSFSGVSGGAMVIKNFNLSAELTLPHWLFVRGPWGMIYNVGGMYGTGDGALFEGINGYGIYYNTAISLKSTRNEGSGYLFEGYTPGSYDFNNNTFISLRSQRNLGYGYIDDSTGNTFLGCEAEHNDLPGLWIRGNYQETDWVNPWFEGNGELGGALTGDTTYLPDIGVVAAGGMSAGGINNYGVSSLIFDGRSGYVLPWHSWASSTGYMDGENVIPPSNAACEANGPTGDGTHRDLCFQKWTKSTSYAVGDVVLPAAEFEGNDRWYQYTVAGTSGTTEPDWDNCSEGQTFTDGTATVECHTISYQAYKRWNNTPASVSVTVGTNGQLTAANVTSGGTGYNYTTIIVPSQIGGQGAVLTPTISSGVITGMTITVPGYGYTPGTANAWVYSEYESGSTEPTWVYSPVGTLITDNQVKWEVMKQDLLLQNGNWLKAHAGNASSVPALGSGGDANFSSASLLGQLGLGTTTYSELGTERDGAEIYCSDCTVANPCGSGGTGAFAKGIDGAWVCN